MGVTATTGTYRFGLFRLDARGTGVSRLDDDGAWIPVAIGARARDLLSLFVRRNGETLPRDEIMQAVWPGVAVEESNLTVQIFALRRALDQAHVGPSCIQTISGRGYRFLPTVTLESADALSDNPDTARPAPAPDRRPRIAGSGSRLSSRRSRASATTQTRFCWRIPSPSSSPAIWRVCRGPS